MHDSNVEKPLKEFGGGEGRERRKPEKVPSRITQTVQKKRRKPRTAPQLCSSVPQLCPAALPPPSPLRQCVRGACVCAPTPQDSGIKNQEVSCSVDKTDRQLQDRKDTRTHTYSPLTPPNENPKTLNLVLNPQTVLHSCEEQVKKVLTLILLS